MPHGKFQGDRTLGSEEEDFLKVLAIYGHGSHLGQATKTKFMLLFARRLHIKFGFDRTCGFREKDV